MVQVSDTTQVWLFMVERGVDSGSDIQVFWRGADAVEAARQYLSTAWPARHPLSSDDVDELIELANQHVGADEYVVLAPFPVVGIHSDQ